jgi:transposase-like protein
MRKSYNSSFKFKVALEAIRGDLTIAQVVSKYKVAASLVQKWKKQLLSEGDKVFASKKTAPSAPAVDIEKLHAKIGKLTLERDFLENALWKSQ